MSDVLRRRAQFQSTRPRGARRLKVSGRNRNGVFQSTRPRGARLSNAITRLTTIQVSIHAPAWGATWCMPIPLGVSKFQSTRPRGARRRSWRILPAMRTFQSTRPRGARLGTGQLIITEGEFQSTRPRGARQVAPSRWNWVPSGFNPRARVGRDDLGGLLRAHHFVSIHAPAWGATSPRAFAR